jgi:hypothetical protein
MVVMDESGFKLKKDYKYVQRWCIPIFYILNVYKYLCDYLYIAQLLTRLQDTMKKNNVQRN